MPHHCRDSYFPFSTCSASKFLLNANFTPKWGAQLRSRHALKSETNRQTWCVFFFKYTEKRRKVIKTFFSFFLSLHWGWTDACHHRQCHRLLFFFYLASQSDCISTVCHEFWWSGLFARSSMRRERRRMSLLRELSPRCSTLRAHDLKLFSSSTASCHWGLRSHRLSEGQQASFPHQSKNMSLTKIFTPPWQSCKPAGPVEDAAAAFSSS